MFTGALLSLALLTPGTGPSEEALIMEVASYTPAAAREDAWQVADRPQMATSHDVACRQEVRPNSRFTRKVCRKARDWHRTSLIAQGEVNSVQTDRNNYIGGR